MLMVSLCCVHVLSDCKIAAHCLLTACLLVCADSHSNNGTGGDAESQLWKHGAFPQYLQESVEASDFCSMIEEARARQDRLNKKSSGKLGQHDLGSQNSSLWRTIRRQAEADAENEPLLSSFLYASILSHGSFERALAFVLANRLSDATLLPTELFEVFYSVLKDHKEVAEAAMADLRAVRERVSFTSLIRCFFLIMCHFIHVLSIMSCFSAGPRLL